MLRVRKNTESLERSIGYPATQEEVKMLCKKLSARLTDMYYCENLRTLLTQTYSRTIYKKRKYQSTWFFAKTILHIKSP